MCKHCKKLDHTLFFICAFFRVFFLSFRVKVNLIIGSLANKAAETHSPFSQPIRPLTFSDSKETLDQTESAFRLLNRSLALDVLSNF